MKKILLSLAGTALCLSALAGSQGNQSPSGETAIPGADTRWFEEARLGMFVHFGPYAMLGAGEWVMNTRPIKASNYLRLQELFNPYAFNAAEWVEAARSAGARYITFTSRHHDSFSNWDTKQSDWNIMNTPFGRDLLRELSDECEKQDMKLVLYYSTLDWMRPDYQWETGRTGQKSGRTGPSDWDSYMEFMKGQLTELITNYNIAGIWFDGHWDQTADENRTDHSTHVDWRYPELYGHIRSLSPDILIANNHHLPPFPGEDYQIFERDVPGENKEGYSGQEVSQLPLETCQTIGKSWGFSINDDEFKSDKELIDLLVRTAGTGANLLLNVGPLPDGRIMPEHLERLAQVGDWMDRHGHTIYGTRRGMVLPQDWGAVTAKDKVYYIHVLDDQTQEITLSIPDFKTARWINLDSELKFNRNKKTGEVTFLLPVEELNPVDSIIEVTVK